MRCNACGRFVSSATNEYRMVEADGEYCNMYCYYRVHPIPVPTRNVTMAQRQCPTCRRNFTPATDTVIFDSEGCRSLYQQWVNADSRPALSPLAEMPHTALERESRNLLEIVLHNLRFHAHYFLTTIEHRGTATLDNLDTVLLSIKIYPEQYALLKRPCDRSQCRQDYTDAPQKIDSTSPWDYTDEGTEND
jgi:hypothetical protein